MLSLKFEIPGSPDDYYEIRERADDLISYKPIRFKIRELAKLQSDYFSYISSEGENTHLAILESGDEIDNFFENEPEDAQACIYATLAEEMDALAKTFNDETLRINQKIEEQSQDFENMGKVLGAIVFIFVIILFFSFLK
ncbi:hypothetical protein EH164_09070 [Kosakonia sp. CCTCC M2018092]|uniref:hypothetical protein n=1 Tax=Kosakonia sp. CCTCC M2018092 TaxID=2492396 RepID=UPI000F60DC86|nr:hypothetical protein [Kosakonia sp. CCTCC M2018092]AZI87191.1 hypothetical protein EH164_09070 [Kosakonia sp. CCTCC M2018092]